MCSKLKRDECPSPEDYDDGGAPSDAGPKDLCSGLKKSTCGRKSNACTWQLKPSCEEKKARWKKLCTSLTSPEGCAAENKKCVLRRKGACVGTSSSQASSSSSSSGSPAPSPLSSSSSSSIPAYSRRGYMGSDEDSGGDSTPSTKLPVPHAMKSNLEEAAANILEQAPTVAGGSSTGEESQSEDDIYDPFTEVPAPHVLEANRKAVAAVRRPWMSQRALRSLGAPTVGGDSSTEEESPSEDNYDPFTEVPAPHVLEENRKAAGRRRPWMSQRALRALGAPTVGGDSSTEESLSESEESTPPLPPWRRRQRRSPL